MALINMPFAIAERPSIQCGLLKSALNRAGHDVEVWYLNLELAAEIGALPYRELSCLRTDLLLGEWLFSVAAFGYRPNEIEYSEERPGLKALCESIGITFERLCEYRNTLLPAWIVRWADAIDWRTYDVVGFTTTFEQNTASFALARAIKARAPEAKVVFGGANFDGDMGREYVRVLPFIDYAVIGEGDLALPALVDRVMSGEPMIGLPGVISRSDGASADAPRALAVQNMNDVPDPNYDEYFRTMFRLGRQQVLAPGRGVHLLIETARGCWWGQKHHCTFCGLNGTSLTFRSKAADDVMEQMRRLAARYHLIDFEAVDNIMDHRYVETLCKPLASRRLDYRLFYEIKANAKPEHLRLMAKAGVRAIQPGIESLNSHVLSLMRKGITMLHNVRCIKWAHYYGLQVQWNILTGFPGETEKDYEQQFRVIQLLRHLPPPSACGRIWLERFSPYFFDRDSFPIENIRPLGAYRHIYPPEAIDLQSIAYFFDYEMGNTVSDASRTELSQHVDAWKAAWTAGRKPELTYQRAPDWIQVLDRRREEPAYHSFDGFEAAVYEFCGETDRTETQVLEELEHRGINVDAEAVREALAKFCALGLMLTEDDRFFSLALPANQNW